MAKQSTSSEIVSMTGFGKASAVNDSVHVSLEIRTVNSRFLDFVFRLPKNYAVLEQGLRESLSERLKRGRVEITVQRVALKEDASRLELQKGVLASYLHTWESCMQEQGVLEKADKAAFISELLLKRDVLDSADDVLDEDSEGALLQSALSEALDGLCAMREREGKKTAEALLLMLDELKEIHSEIKEKAALAPGELKEKLLKRLEALAPEVTSDPARLSQEAAIVADKVDVSEELVRLESHMKQTLVIWERSPNGRKFEFLLQEMGREVNTIGSKVQDAALQKLAVDAKSVLEKMREQALNIE